jgi:hypothetical protein
MTRKKLTSMVVVIRTALTLREGEDDDLLEVFLKVPARKRANFIKSAMRQGGLNVEIEGLPNDDELAEALENFIA